MARGQFEAIKMGLDATAMPDNYLDVVVADMAKAEYLSDKMDGTIVAVIDKIIVGSDA
jgi:hypothetical protein